MTQPFDLYFTETAENQIRDIESDASKKGLIKQLKKALCHLSQNTQHPGLNTHTMKNLDSLFGCKVFSSYVQNQTPQAHRILWCYGPKQKQITILAVIPHY